MEKDYFVPFADYGEDKFEEKRSKFTGRLWHVGNRRRGGSEDKGDARDLLGRDTQLLRLHSP